MEKNTLGQSFHHHKTPPLFPHQHQSYIFWSSFFPLLPSRFEELNVVVFEEICWLSWLVWVEKTCCWIIIRRVVFKRNLSFFNKKI
jgi:hypothetical protein